MALSLEYDDWQGMQWKRSEGWTSLLACSAYNVICKKYDDLLGRHDIWKFIQKTPRRMSTYVHALISPKKFLLQNLFGQYHRQNWPPPGQ